MSTMSSMVPMVILVLLIQLLKPVSLVGSAHSRRDAPRAACAPLQAEDQQGVCLKGGKGRKGKGVCGACGRRETTQQHEWRTGKTRVAMAMAAVIAQCVKA
ncbi:protein of unknown function [Paraburkholderia dioscoreae]|uniref:Uncharacterized protein n=1 Tax=Paraburkholderia dioscoreae TaxID=2604047 RepID=A0A5Q4ZFA1_9BURK|nr:protein of unknown function [Paraburkholderia dioscoreae]